jgi:hypothetical protein
MVKRLATLLMLLALSLPGQTAPRARGAAYELDRDTLALGESLQLRITRTVSSNAAALDTLDLSALQRDFDILERTLGRDSSQETLTLTLYARRSGRYTLPTLGLPGRAPTLSVTEGSDRVPRVQWQLSLDPPEPLLRQPATFTLEACDDGTLLWRRPALPSSEGLLLRPLNETEIITMRDGQRCTAHRWHWALLPTASGTLKLPLPVAEANKFGTRLRYTVPALAFSARPLPAWLPSEAAVGQPEFVAEPLPAQAVIDQPLAWRLRVSGAYSAQALQQLLALELREADARLGLNTYAPQVEPQATLALLPQHRVTLFLAPRERGTFELPALQLPWYDPTGSQLMHARLAASRIEVVDPSRQRWLWAAAVFGAMLASAALTIGLWKLTGWRLRRWRAGRRLQAAGSLEALCRDLLAFSLRPGLVPAATLGDWQQRMAQQCRSQGLEDLVGALERARYGEEVVDLRSMQARVRSWLVSARPR